MKNKRVGIDLRQLRVERKWRQCEAAERLGISRTYIGSQATGIIVLRRRLSGSILVSSMIPERVAVGMNRQRFFL